MRAARAAGLLLALAAATPAGGLAHEVTHQLTREEAVVVTLRYGDGGAFAYEQYEVLPPGETIPFQTGRSDAQGRVAFLPDRPGEWRVKASSEDGHGVDLTVQVDAVGSAAARPRSLWERSSRLAAGIGLLFGIFGVLTLFRRRR
jgi:nickel transport protein